MEVGRNRKLAKDIVTYGVGNIGIKLLSFLLIPLLTFVFEREDIGQYDFVMTIIFILLPITTFQMRESIFRFLIDNNDESYRKSILSTTFFIESLILLSILLVSAFLPSFFEIKYFSLIILTILVYSFYEIYMQTVRVMYSASSYVRMGITTSFINLIMTAVFVLVLKTGISGLFLANIIARLFSIIMIELPKRCFLKQLSIRYVKKEHIREILKYSLPMLITAVSFAFICSVGKFVIVAYLGFEDNGDIAVSDKFMMIVQLLGLTFYMAWQETAVKNFNKSNSSAFFSEVFNKYALLLSLLVICISFGLRSFAFILIDEKFHQSVNLIYVYGLGAMFYCFAMFFEIIFQCTRKTAKILYSILTCALITPFLSIVLTKHYGLMGSVSAYSISIAYLFIFRYFQTKNALLIKLSKEFYLSIFLLTFGGMTFYTTHNNYIDYAVLFAVVIALLLYFFKVIKRYVNK